MSDYSGIFLAIFNNFRFPILAEKTKPFVFELPYFIFPMIYRKKTDISTIYHLHQGFLGSKAGLFRIEARAIHYLQQGFLQSKSLLPDVEKYIRYR